MPRRKSNRTRVLGPYEERGGYRLVIVRPNPEPGQSERTPAWCATEKEALDLKRDLEAESASADVTVSHAIGEWLAGRKAGTIAGYKGKKKPLKEKSVDTARYRLVAFFAMELNLTVSALTPRLGVAAYKRRVESQKADTHRNELSLAKQFIEWCRTRGYTDCNPLEKIEPEGERSVGKEQLRIDESRRFLTTAVQLAQHSDLGGLAATTILLTGIRATECVSIVKRDVDDDGNVLVIPKSKTKAGVRNLPIPRWLGQLLKAAAVGPLGEVFPDKDRQFIYYQIRRICRLAGVPEVPPHGLRGTFASLATSSGSASKVVAESLGHASVAIGERHYISRDALDAARATRVADRLLPPGDESN